MAAIQAKKRTFIVSVQVVNVTCVCGGACENERGSSMIEETDRAAVCPECGERYVVPTKMFSKSQTVKQ